MKLLKMTGGTIALILLVLVLLLLYFQARLIYYPRPYGSETIAALEQRKGRPMEFTTSQGRQVAFYLPPAEASQTEPEFLWLICGGNGSLALDYADEPVHWGEKFGYLFIDYPGYGSCAGTPTPKSIEENACGAAQTLRNKLGWSEAKFRLRTGVFGHSIGCAAALMAADSLHLRAAVLCAPFTTLTEMGRRLLGWPLCYLNLHRFDNVKHLRFLEADGASVRIFHGTEDEVIPTEMSRTMRALFPRTVQLKEVAGGHHNDVVMLARTEIGKAMRDLAGMR